MVVFYHSVVGVKILICYIFFFLIYKLLVHSFHPHDTVKKSKAFFLLLLLFIYFWLLWVFVAACRLSLVVVSGGYPSLQCAGFSLRWLLLLRNTGSRAQASVVVAHGLRCSVACGIFPDQGLNPCPVHWQADS